MERSGTIPHGGIDVSAFSDLYSRPGPFATVCLSTPGGIDNAAWRDHIRWGDARASLERAGAPSEALDAVEAVIPDAHHLGEALAVIADESGVLHVEHSPHPPRRELARWDILPSMATVIEWRQHQLPYVVVLVDHRGADIVASGPGLEDEEHRIEPTGRYPMSRNAPGGWSQRRYQQHAIENWTRNAKDVAAAVRRVADQVQPDVVLIGGDPRSIELLSQSLPGDLPTEQISGSRAVDGGGESTAAEIARVVATTAARQTVEVLEQFRQQCGRDGRAVQGAAATLAALRAAQVDVLLLHDDDERRACFGSEPNLVGLTRSELERVGSGELREARITDVVLRAAAGTGAAVRIVPKAGGPADGLGGILRWSD